MYLSHLGKPSDMDLERYPAVHLTGLHEWDLSVLDFSYPSHDGEPLWSNDPTKRCAFDLNFDEFWDCTHRAILTLNMLDYSSQQMTPFPTMRANQHVLGPTNMLSTMIPLIMKPSGFVLVGSMLILFRNPLNSPHNGESPFPTHFL